MAKTPVSTLQELMTRLGSLCQYELLPADGYGTHSPTFYYRVSAYNMHAIGSAGSKKEAKHVAAKCLLEKLKNNGIYVSSQGDCTSRTQSPIRETEEESGPVLLHYVTSLQEFCTEFSIGQPIYRLIADVGPAHLRHFTVECCIGGMNVTATETTKKKAKQSSAEKMLTRLKDTVPEQFELLKMNTDGNMLMERAIVAHKEHSSIVSKKLNLGIRVSTYPFVFNKIMESKNLTYEDLFPDGLETNKDELEKIFNKLDLKYTIRYELCKEFTMANIIISTEPVFNLMATGNNQDSAFSSALKHCFQHLRIMCY